MTTAAKEPAIGYSITANLNGDRQIVFQHFVGEGDDLNGTLDKIMAAVDRQQAIYKIPELESERKQLTGQIEQGEKDLAAIEADYQGRVAARNKRVLDLQADAKTTFDAAYQEHVKSGRNATTFEPRGLTKQKLAGVEHDLQALVEAAVKDDAERDLALSNLRENNARRQMRIAAIDAEIAELRAKV